VQHKPIHYRSWYSHEVDAKRRVQIPAKWRPTASNGSKEGEVTAPEEQELEFNLIVWPEGEVNEACLLVLPEARWNALVAKLEAMPFGDPKAQKLRRLIGTKSDSVTVDRSGRICLPEWMAKAVGIEQKAMLVGLVDLFQIWSPEKYGATKKEDEQCVNEAFALV
jgi:MraZ protein